MTEEAKTIRTEVATPIHVVTEVLPDALIHVRPDIDPAVQALQEAVTRLVDYATNRSILTDQDARLATDDLATIRALKRTLEAKRTEYTNPINRHLKDINAVFKTLSDPLDTADKTTSSKITGYRNEQARQAAEAKRINDLRIEAALAEQVLKGEITQPLELVVEPPPPPTHVRGEVGTAGIVRTRKYRLIDIKLVPPEYLWLNDPLVGKVVRAGIPSIPGIEIYIEEGIRVTQR